MSGVQRDIEVVQALTDIPLQPPNVLISSTTASTRAPSSASRRAIIKPISPEPRIITRLPIMMF